MKKTKNKYENIQDIREEKRTITIYVWNCHCGKRIEGTTEGQVLWNRMKHLNTHEEAKRK